MKKLFAMFLFILTVMLCYWITPAIAITSGYKGDKSWIPYCKVIEYEGNTYKVVTHTEYLKIVRNTKNYWQVKYLDGNKDVIVDIHKTMDAYRYYNKRIAHNGDVVLVPTDWFDLYYPRGYYPDYEVVRFLRSGKIVTIDNRKAIIEARAREKARKIAENDKKKVRIKAQTSPKKHVIPVIPTETSGMSVAEARDVLDQKERLKQPKEHSDQNGRLRELMYTLKEHAILCFRIYLSESTGENTERADVVRYLNVLEKHRKNCNCDSCLLALRQYCSKYYVYKVSMQGEYEWRSDSLEIDSVNDMAERQF